MPHFKIDCSENILLIVPVEEIIKLVHDTAEETGLFKRGDIKVRVNTFAEYTTRGTKEDFIHITADIMGGRTTEQKQNLSKCIIRKLKPFFPKVKFLSIDIRDIDPETYTNLAKI